MSIKLPFRPSVATQKAIAILAAAGALLQTVSPLVSGKAGAVVTGALILVAAFSGFLKKVEPLMDDLDKYAE